MVNYLKFRSLKKKKAATHAPLSSSFSLSIKRFLSVFLIGFAMSETNLKRSHQLGDITINSEELTVSFPVKINQRKGSIEYILVGGSGKLHEALLQSSVDIIQLNAALKLINLKKGDAINITASWTQFGKSKKQAIYEWMSYDDEKALKPEWVYIGSNFNKNGKFIAAINEDIISIKPDDSALISYRGEGHDDENSWSAIYKKIPLIETITFTIQKTTLNHPTN